MQPPPEASLERLAGCTDREGGVQMSSPCGGVRDVRERKRRTQTERRGKGAQWQAGAECAQGGRSAPKTRIKNCAGESSVRRR